MGQYYRPSILKTNYKLAKNPVETTLYSFDFAENGLKLMEHSWAGNALVCAFIHLIGENSPYYGKPCVWAGDYADAFTSRMVKDKNVNIYDLAKVIDEKLGSVGNRRSIIQHNEKYKKVFGKDIFYNDSYKDYRGNDVPFVNCVNNLDSYKYVINLRTKEYIEIPECDESKWTVHPLPLLLAESNGQGGGDYNGINAEICGRWAYHPIGATNEIPEGFKHFVVEFEE